MAATGRIHADVVETQFRPRFITRIPVAYFWAHVPAPKLPLAVRGESPSLGWRESVPDNGIWISSAAFARLPVVTSTQTVRARRHSKRSHLCWPQSASSRTWQGRRSYAFFRVRTHPLSSGWVWIGIGPTHFWDELFITASASNMT